MNGTRLRRPRRRWSEQARAALAAQGAELARAIIGQRAAARPPVRGRADGVEIEPTGKTAAEVAALYDWRTEATR